MKYLKSVARMSKEKMNLLFKVHSTDVEVIEKVVKKDNVYDYYLSAMNPTEQELESCCLKDYSEKEYDFKYTFNGITTDKFSLSLSKSMIKQYLFLHFIPANKSKIRKKISYSSLAKSLNLSVVTVRKNMDRLVKLGFIWVSEVDRGLYDIVIVDEHKFHEYGGNGYFTMSLDMLYHLLSFNNINELKIELKKILWCDAKKSNPKMISFNKNNLLNVLPDYIRPCKKKEILESTKSMFKLENNTLNYDAYKSKSEILKPIRESFIDIIKDFFDFTKMPYDNFCAINKNNPAMKFKVDMEKALVLSDLAGLSIQYNIDLVMKALMDIYINLGDSDRNDVINMGGFVRSWIESYLACNKMMII